MPSLPLPAGPITISGGDLPVSDASDVLAEFPEPMRRPDVAPVRDAFCEAYADGFIAYQSAAETAAALCDPLRATGDYLLDKASEYSVFPSVGESEPSLRSRIWATPTIVTPAAIEGVINAIIAPRTCRVSEPELDGWFVHDAAVDSAWESYVGAEPDYPDRDYDVFPGTMPGGAVPSNGLPRTFRVRIPVLDASDTNFAFIGEMFVGAGCFIFQDPQTANELYNAIVGQVQAIKGQGIAWSLIVDPSL
jgi:hypothetical protein